MNDLIKSSRIATVLLLPVSLLALVVALWSVLDPAIYAATLVTGNINEFLRMGSIAQDLVTIPLAALLGILAIRQLIKPNLQVFITMLGLAGYLFYAYGLYVMQAQYTSLYAAYLLIFGLSLYGLITGLASFNSVDLLHTTLPRAIRIAIAIFLAAILIVLVPVWLMLMLPAIAQHQPPDTYAVFVLDLAIVFPALGVVTVMLLRRIAIGNLFAGVALFKAFTVCLSVAFSEWYSPMVRGTETNVGGLMIFGILTVVSGVLYGWYLRGLREG